MAETAIKLPVKNEGGTVPAAGFGWYPFGSLRREIDRLFDDFDLGSWNAPFRRSVFSSTPFGYLASRSGSPAIDVVEKDGEYEITAELPGMEEKDIDIRLSNGVLMIKGEKKETREEKRKDYYLSERRYGAFERSFAVPEGIDASKIAASFKSGILTVTLPKTPAAQQQEKKIAIKAA